MGKTQRVNIKCGGSTIQLKTGEERVIMNSIVTNSPIRITQMTKHSIDRTKNGIYDNMVVQGVRTKENTLRPE